VKGANGIFDVAVDGKLLFSKNRDRGFPAEAEVVSRLRQISGKPAG
jgi:selT/selW/selH-like putative selenoprotein